MRILIFTSGKTGSTALAGTLQRTLPGHKLEFEPKRLDQLSDDEPNLIVKSIAVLHWGTEVKKFPTYDRRIFLARHPFDRLVSALLYAPFNGQGFETDEGAGRYVSLLRRKVERPESVSVMEICDLFGELSGMDLRFLVGEEVRCHGEFKSAHGSEFHTLLYEDLVANRWQGLETYLGFPLRKQLVVPPGFERVARGKRSGDWKRWFLPSDQKVLGEKWSRYFELFSDHDRHEALERHPVISHEESVAYTVRMINQYRRGTGLPDYRDETA
ncbi:hypothetical protein [Pelagicoccus sp. SDUM812003]|uniref:hypothetical protein n=1 Tax=Pelagicoccus sp. SDUM812003 TaxID=3041267 RepID=UPI0028106019|nr:hypothetical protein [Pelagicoccus sp. SDUM812003]MDQ8202665.1 hypothetical protein [Pelagicoccus sp. SDUM812003]